MPKAAIRLGVIAISTPPATAWAKAALRPYAVMADLPPLAPGTVMSDHGGERLVYLGDHALMLHSGDTGHYRDNLGQARPSVWVALEGDAVSLVTVDPYEGEGLASDPGKVTEALAMPLALARQLQEFITAHHREEPFVKRKRRPAGDPDARAPRVLSPDQKWGRR